MRLLWSGNNNNNKEFSENEIKQSRKKTSVTANSRYLCEKHATELRDFTCETGHYVRSILSYQPFYLFPVANYDATINRSFKDEILSVGQK